MILNENYFDDIEITDDDIDISNNNEYATPEEWFAGMKSRYTHCIEIPLNLDCKWKWDLSLILKRLFYVFYAYGMEYSEPTLQEFIHVEDNLENGYSQCNFIDYNGYKFISSKYKTMEAVYKTNTNISVVIFFNFPVIHSYKAACVFISSILSCISIKDITSGYFIIWDFKAEPYGWNISRKYMDNKMIERIIRMFFPKKKYDDIKEELYADNNALLNKLLRCFGPWAIMK